MAREDEYFKERILEEAKLKKLGHPSPPMQGSFLSQYGYLPFFLIGGVLFLLTFIIKVNDAYWITPIQFAMALVFLIVLELIVRLFRLREKKEAKVIQVVPFEPEREVPELEEKFLRMGRNVRIRRHIGEPQYGEGSAEPYCIHFRADETMPNGLTRPLQFRMVMVNRSIVDVEEDHSHIENNERNWADFPKHPVYVPSGEKLYRPLPVYIEPVSRIKSEKEKEKEEESEEKEESE